MLHVCQNLQRSGGHWVPELSYRWLRAAQQRPARVLGAQRGSPVLSPALLSFQPRGMIVFILKNGCFFKSNRWKLAGFEPQQPFSSMFSLQWKGLLKEASWLTFEIKWVFPWEHKMIVKPSTISISKSKFVSISDDSRISSEQVTAKIWFGIVFHSLQITFI